MASTSNKGLIILEPKSSILHEQLHSRILSDKREPCEISFNDFDGVSFKMTCERETLNIVTVQMSIYNINELKRSGAKEVIDRLYPGCEVSPETGFDLALRFNCDSVPGGDNQRFLTNISELRRNVMGGPLDRAFNALLAHSSGNVPLTIVEYRKNEPVFICPSAAKVVVIFAVDFSDPTDRALAKVFLQEFVEAQRVVRNAPPVSYSREPPGELSGVSYGFRPDIAGYLSFSVEERHITGPGKDNAISLLTSFRNYLHYHIKCSKTYLHMRMRKKVVGWMQVLNRAMPDVETEKKTASGKSFVKK